jgi:hypothetical protein
VVTCPAGWTSWATRWSPPTEACSVITPALQARGLHRQWSPMSAEHSGGRRRAPTSSRARDRSSRLAKRSNGRTVIRPMHWRSRSRAGRGPRPGPRPR